MRQGTDETKCVSSLSKKRYDEIILKISEIIDDKDKVEDIKNIIKTVMRFDPDDRTFSANHAKKIRLKQIEKAMENGQSLYEYLGYKQRYHRKKQEREKKEKEEKEKREKEQKEQKEQNEQKEQKEQKEQEEQKEQNKMRKKQSKLAEKNEN